MASLNIQSKIEEIRSKFASRPRLLGQMTSGAGIGASGIKVFGQGLGAGLGTGTGPVMTALQNLRNTVQKSRPGVISKTPIIPSGLLSRTQSSPSVPRLSPPTSTSAAKIKTY